MGRSSGGTHARQSPGATRPVGPGGAALPASARTVGLVGHAGSGKTQLAELMLHAGGVVREAGAVDRGTTLLDGTPSGPDAGALRWPSFAWLPWSTAVVHLVDTPGGTASAWPARLALAGVDLEVLVVSGPAGVECGAEDVLARAARTARPLIAVVNKLDRPTDLDGVLAGLALASGRRVVPLQLPLWEGRALAGVIDLLDEVAVRYDPEGGGACSREPLPTDRSDEVRSARESLLEAIALTDETLLEAYLERLELSPEQAWAGLANAVHRGEVLPVVLASATRGIGGAPLLDVVVRLAPDPATWCPGDATPAPRQVAQWVGTRLDEDGAPLAVLRVWGGTLAENQLLANPRTGGTFRLHKIYQLRGPRRSLAKVTGPGALVATWDLPPGQPGDVLTDGPDVALEPPAPRPPMAWRVVEPIDPRRRRDLDAALARLALLDASVDWVDEPGGGVRLAGASHGQLDAWVAALQGRLGVAVRSRLPPVAYVERPVRAATGSGVHRKADGDDVIEFGEIEVEVEPIGAEAAFGFVSEVDEDDLPPRFLPAVEAGALRALADGPLAGFPVVGVGVRCLAGAYDAIVSKDAHLAAAGERAVRAALEAAGTELLEPWSDVELILPGDDVGAVLTDLSAHRARIVGLEVVGRETAIRATCPEGDLGTLGRRLEALTRGRGWFLARRSHHERVPRAVVEGVVAGSAVRRSREAAVEVE